MTAAKMPPKTILIVDDNQDIRESLVALLEHEGFATVTAEHGANALELLHEGVVPCMILLDYHMPVMDGVTFRLRQITEPNLADIPVILYSGAFDIREQAKTLGVAHVFQKPIDPNAVMALVRHYCG